LGKGKGAQGYRCGDDKGRITPQSCLLPGVLISDRRDALLLAW